MDSKAFSSAITAPEGSHYMTFGGGCFWCMESPFRKIAGVHYVVPGYMGGKTKNPTYEEVCTGRSGHIEVVQVAYDPEKCKPDDLLYVYWRSVDPTQVGGQFHDIGEQYSTVIFYHDDNQKEIAKTSKQALEDSGRFSDPIATIIREAETFYIAEDYHHQYDIKNPGHYNMYKQGSGRPDFICKIWDDEL